MPIRMLCPDCRQPLTVADHLGGKRINCPKCKNQLQVPTQEGAPVQTPAPAPARPEPSQDDDLSLNMPGQDRTRNDGPEEHKRCPGCGRDLPADSVLCTGCGHDFRTGQRRKGFEMQDPEKLKRIFDSVLRNGFFLILLVGGLGGIYYAYTKGLFSADALKNLDKKEEVKDEQKTERAAKPKAPEKKKKDQKPPENKDSMLVVVNSRFGHITIYSDRERIGEVGYRATQKIVLAPPPDKQSTQISFEARIPVGQELAENVKNALTKGLAFSGTTQQGLRVTMAGPPEELVPAPDEILTNVLVDLEVIKDSATGLGLISVVKYKDCTLKPVAPQKKLMLAYGQKEGKAVVKWLVQECVVERSGKAVYQPVPVPFETFGANLVVTEGKVDVEE